MLRARGVAGNVLAAVFAILPEHLPSAATRSRFREFSLFPAALRDLALVVDIGTPAGTVRADLARIAAAKLGGGFALESIDIFDLYEGEGLPPGKKSLAFSLVFRSDSRTLTDDEVNGVLAAIKAELEGTTAYQLRK
jgi:phenylalanyl-tRNA synthetase beta chain